MANAIFLSEATLKDQTAIQDNVDTKVLKPTILHVENFYLLPILGTSLFNDLKTKIIAKSLSTVEKSLMDLYITPVMVWWTLFESPIVMNYKYFNKAVGTQNADNMTPITESEMFRLMDHTRNAAEVYSERLTKYLLQNNTTFPLYLNQPNVGIDTIFAKRNNFNSGMVLDEDFGCMGKNNFRNIPVTPPELRKPCTFC